MTTVWRRLCDAGRTSVSFPTFHRHVVETVRAVDPARLTVLLADPAFGEAMEIDYGRLGMWTDPVGGRRRAVWAFVATLRASGMHFRSPGPADGSRDLDHLPRRGARLLRRGPEILDLRQPQ